jgi:hypothetical protein
MLAEQKADFVFEPRRGFASRGLIDSAAVGRARLRRLLRQGDGATADRQAGHRGRRSTPVDGSARLGLPRRNRSSIGTRVAVAGAAGPRAARRLAADLCFAVTNRAARRSRIPCLQGKEQGISRFSAGIVKKLRSKDE